MFSSKTRGSRLEGEASAAWKNTSNVQTTCAAAKVRIAIPQLVGTLCSVSWKRSFQQEIGNDLADGEHRNLSCSVSAPGSRGQAGHSVDLSAARRLRQWRTVRSALPYERSG